MSRAGTKGMLHPGVSLTSVVKGCFECHVIDDEQLVNRGGHPALSKGFELESWFRGEVKHAFLISKGEGKLKTHGDQPQPIPQGRRRMMFLTGRLLQLGYTLKALSQAKDPPLDRSGKPVLVSGNQWSYGVQHALTARELIEEIALIQKTVSLPEYAQALAAVSALRFETGEQEAMGTLGGEMIRLAGELGRRADIAALGAVDSFLRDPTP